MKIEKSGLSVMTYDFSTAILVDATGVDVIDAGASTLDALERFCEEVRDGRPPRRRALLLNQNDTIVEEKKSCCRSTFLLNRESHYMAGVTAGEGPG